MAQMTMRRGPEPGREYQLVGKLVKIGRGRKNHIIIHDNEVSREHCELRLQGDSYELRDLGSSNGTFVNGQPVTQEGWLLKSDCIIEIGDSITFEFVANPREKTEEITPVVHPYLVVITNSQREKPDIYPLHGSEIVIGRDLTNNIVIQEPEVSRQHLCLRLTDQGYSAEDLGSTNGTFLNGEDLESQTLLRLNDMLELGTMVKLLFTDDPSKYLSNLKTDILGAKSGEDDETLQKKMIDDSRMLNRTTRRTETSELSIGLEPGKLVGYFFLAYAPEDWSIFVKEFFDFLSKRHLPVWTNKELAAEDPGWERALDQVLSECEMLLVVVSELALDTSYVRRSWRYFHNREKPIILMLYHYDDPLPMELRNLPTVRFDADDPQESYMEVIAEIMRLGI